MFWKDGSGKYRKIRKEIPTDSIIPYSVRFINRKKHRKTKIQEEFKMKILVVNAGSSSLKYQLIDMENEHVLAKGICERIGFTGCISHKTADGRKYEAGLPMPTHSEAFKCLSTC